MRSYFNAKSHGETKYGDLLTQVQTTLNQGGLSGAMSADVASLESWSNPATASQLTANLKNNAATIDQIINVATDGKGLVASLESFEEAGIVSTSASNRDWIKASQENASRAAAAISLEAAGNPEAYRAGFAKSAEAFNKRNANQHFDYVADYTNGARASALGILAPEEVSMEAFENNNLATSMNYSVVYNLVAAVQEPALEALFKTIVLAPDQVCFYYEIQVDRFWNGFKHTTETAKKLGRNFDKYNLMDAVRKPSILRQDVLNIVPFYRETGADAAHYQALFMDKAISAPVTRTVAGVEVPTQPLKVGVEYDLLDISAHPGLLNGGVFDETDTIDSYLALDKVYITMGATASADTVVEFPVRHLERANFFKSVQGHGFDMDLNFRTTDLLIDGRTMSVNGKVPAEVKAFVDAGYRARLELTVVGSANVETSYMQIQHAQVKVVDVYKVTKGTKGQPDIVDKVDINDPTVAAEVKKLHLACEFFYPYGNRTNRNLRSQGFTVDTDVFTAKIAIGVRSPVRLQRPVGSEATYPTVDKLVQVTRTRQSADGWYEFFQYRDTLAAYVASEINDGIRTSGMIGFGKYLIKPHYEKLEVNLADLVKSTETRYNIENAREGLLAILQEAAARAIVKSQYNVASTMLNDGKQVKPHFVIVTDNYLPLLLSARGDLRLLGENFGHTVVTTTNEELDNKIFMTVAVPESDEFNELRFGHCFMYPELVTTLSPHNQNGAYKETVMVSPRYQHVPNLPLLIEVDVKGVQEFMTTYNKYRVLSQDVK